MGPCTSLFTEIRTLCRRSTDREVEPPTPGLDEVHTGWHTRIRGQSDRMSAGGSSESEAPSSESTHPKTIPGRAHEYQMIHSMGGLTAACTMYVCIDITGAGCR